MTTNNHTEMTTGGAANVSRVETPLAELDAAIGDLTITGVVGASAAAQITALDTRVDTIIASSGTSSTEVVDARGTYTVLSQRLDDVTFPSSTILVDANFSGDEAAHKRYTTIGAAMAACSGGETILVSPGIYTEEVTFSTDNVSLIGSAQPAYDSATGRLVGGTILRGRVQTGSTYIGQTIRDLGVDMVGTAGGKDCIVSAAAGGTHVYRRFQNLTLLGDGYADAAHGLYCAGDNITANNIHVIDCYHGIAIHGSYGNYNNLLAERCAGSSVIVKSKASVGSVYGVNINNVTIWGDDTEAAFADWAGGVVIQAADGEETRWVNVSNVSAHSCVNGVVNVARLASSGTISDIQFTNVISNGNQDYASVGDFWLTSGTRLTFIGCGSLDRVNGYGWNADAAADDLGSVYVYDAIDDASNALMWTGTFTRLEINGKDVIDRTYQIVRPRNVMTGGLSGTIPSAAISVTAANTPVAVLSQLDGRATGGFSGLLLVHVRTSATTSSNVASYCLWVHMAADTTTATVTVIAAAGYITGSAAQTPSVTFTVNATNQLLASPIASSSCNMYFDFVTLGNLLVTAL